MSLLAIDDVRASLRRITGLLTAREPLPRSSLYIGEAGVALCLGLASRALDDAELWDAAITRLGLVLEQPSRLSSFAGGFFGELWVGEMFALLGVDIDLEVDEALDARIAARDAEYDLLNGWAGIAVYALARRAKPGGAERLAGVIGQLDRTARREGGGVTWFRDVETLPQDSRAQFPRGHYNLGIDHGHAGVIGVLADVTAAGDDAAALLDDAVAWLLAQRRAGPGRVFPALIDPELGELVGRPDAHLFGDTGRESWSYGDLGIATALLAAARVRRRSDWEATALEIARRTAAQLAVTDQPWADFGGGRAGLAYLFTCLHRATGDGAFAAAAREWLEAAWAGLRDDLTSTVMTGIAGIGLATIAALHDRATPWETAFGVGATACLRVNGT